MSSPDKTTTALHGEHGEHGEGTVHGFSAKEPAMTITTTKLTRAAGLGAVVAGLLFIGVQTNHPHLDVTFVTTTEWKVRQTLKVLMATLSLIGITGMYLRQVKESGLLGLIGYLLFGAGYLMIMSIEVVGRYVLPSLAHSAPGYVNDVLAVATGGTATGDIGQMQTLIVASGIAYLAGGFIFGIALFRANVLARWAAALLAVGTVLLSAPFQPAFPLRAKGYPWRGATGSRWPTGHKHFWPHARSAQALTREPDRPTTEPGAGHHQPRAGRANCSAAVADSSRDGHRHHPHDNQRHRTLSVILGIEALVQQLITPPTLLLLGDLDRDVDDHVFLAADVSGFADALQDLVCRYSVAGGCAFGVQQEARVNAGIALHDRRPVGDRHARDDRTQDVLCRGQYALDVDAGADT
jgi:hypothetical protein